MHDFGEIGNTRVLIVDDQKEIHDDFREMLQGGDVLSSEELARAFGVSSEEPALPAFELLHAATGEEACEIVSAARERDQPVAAAFVDVRMPPGMNGVETIRRMRDVDREVEIVIMTAYTEKPLADIVENLELLHKLLYIRKPFAREEIQQMTLSLVTKWNVEREVAAGRKRREAVLDATADAIAMYDRDARLVFANRCYERLFDISLDELRALPREAAMARFTERLRDQPSPDADGRFPSGRDDGNVVEPTGSNGGRQRKPSRSWSTQPVRDDDGTVIGDLVVYREASRDIEIERMKLEIQRLRSELETCRRRRT